MYPMDRVQAVPQKEIMMNYWGQKKENRIHAWALTEALKIKARDEIVRAAEQTKLYGEQDVVPDVQPVEGVYTKIATVRMTTVDAAFEEAKAGRDTRICLLNFASYKEPGGMFMQGSMAQEESLCHASVLYLVLASDRVMGMFYNKHGKMLNRALYHSDLLYSPDVLFFLQSEKKGRRFDVITCAAPNKKTAQRYNGVSDGEVEQAMYHRIDSILYTAWKEGAEVLILGAFGCGVFGNDLSSVSSQFKELLSGKYRGCFRRAVFAVPDERSFLTMKEILEG